MRASSYGFVGLLIAVVLMSACQRDRDPGDLPATGQTTGEETTMPPQQAARPVKLSMLLDKDARTPDDIRAVQVAARQLGLTPTASGAATLSFETDPATFTTLFGVALEPHDAATGSVRDVGLRGGYVSTAPLNVPDSLANRVVSIGVEGPYIRLRDEDQERD